MLKSLVTVLALSASVLAVPKREPDGLPKCGAPAAQSCNRLPAKSTRSCLASISSKNIAIKTCATPTSIQIVTVTETAKPRFWKTTTQVITSTSTFTSHTNTTVFSTAVQTNIVTVTETATDSAFNTLTSTFHTNVTSTKVSTTKSTITSTLVKDQTKETCAVRRAEDLEGLEKRNRDRLPDDCSCFLTSTSYSGVQTYSTTVTSTPTITTTKIVPAKATITTTWIITVPVTSTAISTQQETTTVTTTEKVTEVITTTWSLTTTQVTTEVQTKTATSVLDVCATAAPLPSSINGDRATNGQPVPRIKNFADCCRACFKTAGCVFYDFDPSKNDCTVFTPKNSGDCKTDSCPRGKADVEKKRANRDLFGYGPCIGAVW